MWSAGATISPFIIERFLIEVVELANKFNATVGSSQFEYSMNTSMTSGYRSSAAGDVATTSSYFRTAQDVVTGADDVPLEGLELVRYAYVVIGLIALLTVVPMTVLQCYLSGPFASSRKHQKSDDRGRNNLNSVAAEKSLQLQVSTSSRRRHLVINFVYLAVVFLIGFLYGGLETTPRSFLTSFAIRHLSWSVRNATWCMSVFYGTFCFGRIIAVPQSAILSPGVSLIVGIVLVGSGLGLLELLDLDVILSPIFVWISSGLAGFGMSSMFASLLLVVCMAEPTDDARRTVSLSTPTIVSMLGIGCFIGSTVFPFVVGYLFDHISPMWMVYVLIGDVTSLTGLLFLKRTLG
jgi:FHS family Na+ dependent glucose MFS transporter 1